MICYHLVLDQKSLILQAHSAHHVYTRRIMRTHMRYT